MREQSERELSDEHFAWKQNTLGSCLFVPNKNESLGNSNASSLTYTLFSFPVCVMSRCQHKHIVTMLMSC